MIRRELLVSFLLRAGLAVVFLYAAVAAFITPDSWVGFLPSWMKQMFPESVLLAGFSIYEIVLGVWLLSGWRVFAAAVLSALTLGAIVLTNVFAFDIIFRDVAIVAMALALAVMSRRPSAA